jgi:Tat protein secretion system quality control protein TatD with DNase activity
VISLDERFCIGEIGIDYRKDVLEINSKERQQDFFVRQLEMSFLMNRTVTVHCVRAHGELLKMFKRYHQLFSQGRPGVTERERQLREGYKGNPIIMHSYGGSK